MLLTGSALANGTPIDQSDIEATGGTRMVRQSTIALEKETLHIVIDGDDAFIDWLADTDLESQRTTRLTLTIDDVYAGDRHEDTCIAEIYLLGVQ